MGSQTLRTLAGLGCAGNSVVTIAARCIAGTPHGGSTHLRASLQCRGTRQVLCGRLGMVEIVGMNSTGTELAYSGVDAALRSELDCCGRGDVAGMGVFWIRHVF